MLASVFRGHMQKSILMNLSPKAMGPCGALGLGGPKALQAKFFFTSACRLVRLLHSHKGERVLFKGLAKMEAYSTAHLN